ncbi:MAG: stage 0 sporulation family protein [Oscillospiraceae bacterium]|jgi:cell fate regulator YaaT (PSP1 superfamily)|nr:stage 0 sporulation family protein [Oscillospiraceae bacterium]
MIQVVGIRFRKTSKIYFFDPTGYELGIGDAVIVETVRGVELGLVSSPMRELPESQVINPLKPILRVATDMDLSQAESNIANEKTAHAICQERILAHKLDMKLVDVEYTFDGTRVVFYFTANGRVDFRQLVKNLASIFKTRIELRQIGVRDEAKMLGGLGSCGRSICCGTFLSNFQPVSIKMAKEQNLSLNPTKISGLCGRLMCCLKYEQDYYEKVRKSVPKIGRTVMTPDGAGIVLDVHVIREKVAVRLNTGDANEVHEYPLESIQRIEHPHDASDADDEFFLNDDIIMIEEAEIPPELQIPALE